MNLLERFGDKQHNRISSNQLSTTARSSPSSNNLNRLNASSLQRTPQPVAAVAHQQQQQQRMLAPPYTSVYRNLNNNINSSVMSSQMQLLSTPQLRAEQELRRRTPFPVVDESSRSALDRIVDFIVGDSPQNRFGMICKQCHRHNGEMRLFALDCNSILRLILGMLPLEEYEYTTFHCAFCGVLNPARKERPVAPRLSLNAGHPQTPKSALQGNDSTESDSSDDEDEEFGD